jgi:hypothetical protein
MQYQMFIHQNASIVGPYILVAIYLTYITLDLWYRDEIEFVYQRPFPRNLKMLKNELYKEWETVKTIFHHAFPLKQVFIVALVCIGYLIFLAFSWWTLVALASLSPVLILPMLFLCCCCII